MRTFVAVEITNEKLLDSISTLQSELKIRATPVGRQNMHFTLLFLGEIDESSAENVKRSLSTISFKPFEIHLNRVGVFPNPKFPRIIWLGVDDLSSKQLIELASQVEKKLGPLGFKSDKPFKPHLTIFRVKNKIDDITKMLERYNQIDLGSEVVTELKFKQSVLTSNGPIYSDLQVITAK